MLDIHSASLVILLANLWVTDSLTLKIKTSKIPETWILVLQKIVQAKITNHIVGVLLLKHDAVGQILYFSAASQHAMIERAGSSRHSLPVPMSVVATTCWTWTTVAL